MLSGKSGGETGIRTLGTREGSTVFETAPFDHSGTSPRGVKGRLKWNSQARKGGFGALSRKMDFSLSRARKRLGFGL